MLKRQNLIISFVAVLFAIPASAGSIDVVNLFQQFGTIDLTNGAFSLVGPGTPVGDTGLVAGPNGSLFTLTVSGDLDSINPATGLSTVIGPTGLGDCSMPPVSACGPNSANNLGELEGVLYATDFANNLYSVNPATGAATLIGATGIPDVPAVPFSANPDGSINLFDSTLFGAKGKLYATFDAFNLASDGVTVTSLVPDELYQIDPLTGVATLISSAPLQLTAATDVNGTVYAFQAGFNAANPFPGFGQLVTLDLTNGTTNFVSNVDPTAGPIFGAAPGPTPEPSSLALFGVGIAVIRTVRKRG
jgi:hypothetical protein